MRLKALVLLLTVLVASAVSAGERLVTFVHPKGFFSLDYPADWEVAVRGDDSVSFKVAPKLALGITLHPADEREKLYRGATIDEYIFWKIYNWITGPHSRYWHRLDRRDTVDASGVTADRLVFTHKYQDSVTGAWTPDRVETIILIPWGTKFWMLYFEGYGEDVLRNRAALDRLVGSFKVGPPPRD